MRFDLTDEQDAIVETVDQMFEDHLGLDRLRSHAELGSWDVELWDELRTLGFVGTAIPVEYDGQDLGLLELGLVCESAGRALAPVPYIAAAAAGLLIAEAGSEAQRERLLPGIASGDRPGSVAVVREGSDPLSIDPELEGPLVIVEDGKAKLAGDLTMVESVSTIDLLRRYREVRSPGASHELLEGEIATSVDAIEVILAAELTGLSQRALDTAVAYASEREQFGKSIGSFQGVSHRLAEIAVEVESARSIWRYAAWAHREQTRDLSLAASAAKVSAVSCANRSTNGALQVLGGIGFTWEHEIHLMLRRARVGATVLGDATGHRRRIAEMLAGSEGGGPGHLALPSDGSVAVR